MKKLLINGKWNFMKKPSSSEIIYKLNKTTELFHLEFIPGATKDEGHKYTVWSMTNGNNRTSVTKDLVDYIKTDLEFNITVTCSNYLADGKFLVIFSLNFKYRENFREYLT